MSTLKEPAVLDPSEEGLDEMTRRRRTVLADMRQMSTEQLFQLAVDAGIYAKDGELTEPYQAGAAPSASRPTD